MSKQGFLFEIGTPDLRPIDPHVRADDVPRLSNQCQEILAALKQGPKTNAELAGIALKYTSRLSDIRRAGYKIKATHTGGGTYTYTLKQ